MCGTLNAGKVTCAESVELTYPRDDFVFEWQRYRNDGYPAAPCVTDLVESRYVRQNCFHVYIMTHLSW